jgi:hypothetical protein
VTEWVCTLSTQTFVKAAIIKKKYYFGVTTNGEIKAVEMGGKKNMTLFNLRDIWHPC